MGTPLSDMQREFELKQSRTRDVYRRVGWNVTKSWHSNNSDPRDPWALMSMLAFLLTA